MRVSELLVLLDKLAPFALTEPWDNCGLQVGDEAATVKRILAALELTEEVLSEAVEGEYDTVVTHHPLLFAATRKIVESERTGHMLRKAIRADISVISCHTNLDASPGGLAHIVTVGLGLQNPVPLQMSSVNWCKLVGFVPAESLPAVAQAVFAAGAGNIGEYSGCAYATEGQGWFTPGAGASPAVGEIGTAERVPETRWETVVPRDRLNAAVAAYVAAHPYEEPAFDVYPIEDRAPGSGLGRVGTLVRPMSVAELATTAAAAFELPDPLIGGETRRMVSRVAVLPGSGRNSLVDAAKMADVLITGDLCYHDSEKASALGLALISLPHGDLEWAAMKRWLDTLREALGPSAPVVAPTTAWRPPWVAARGRATQAPTSAADKPVTTSTAAAEPAASARQAVKPAAAPAAAVSGRGVTMWIDGGSRGNPGPSGIGVVLKSRDGELLEEVGKFIGTCTNNVAEYSALLEGLDMASRLGATDVEVVSDSELLVKQLRGQYRVKNEGLKELFAAASAKIAGFGRFHVRHVLRGENTRADSLLNEALDAATAKTSTKARAGAAGGSDSPGLF